MANNGSGGGHRPAPTRQQPPPMTAVQKAVLGWGSYIFAVIFTAMVLASSPVVGEQTRGAQAWTWSGWAQPNALWFAVGGTIGAIALTVLAARRKPGAAFKKTGTVAAVNVLLAATAALAAAVFQQRAAIAGGATDAYHGIVDWSGWNTGWNWATDCYGDVVEYLADPTAVLYGGVAAGMAAVLILGVARVFVPRPSPYGNKHRVARVLVWGMVVLLAIAAGVIAYSVGSDVFNTLHAAPPALTESDIARLIGEAAPAPDCTPEQLTRLLAEAGQVARDSGGYGSEAAQAAVQAIPVACARNAPAVPIG